MSDYPPLDDATRELLVHLDCQRREISSITRRALLSLTNERNIMNDRKIRGIECYPMLDFCAGKCPVNPDNSKPWPDVLQELSQKEIAWIYEQLDNEDSGWGASLRACFFRLVESESQGGGIKWVNCEGLCSILNEAGKEGFLNDRIGALKKIPSSESDDFYRRFAVLESKFDSVMSAVGILYKEFTGRDMPLGIGVGDEALPLFVETRIKSSKGETITTEELWVAYSEFCVGQGFSPITKGQFEKRVSDLMKASHGVSRVNYIERNGKSRRGYNHVVLVD